LELIEGNKRFLEKPRRRRKRRRRRRRQEWRE